MPPRSIRAYCAGQIAYTLGNELGRGFLTANWMNPGDVSADSDPFRQYLANLGQDIEPGSGFFLPGTVFWRVSREPVLLLAGMRALLLQIAHPKIAQGVADHSRYREDPLGRGIRTFTAVYSLVFGDRDAAVEAAMRVRAVHNRVHGRVVDPLPSGMDPVYDANDPDLLLWVAATLLDSSVVAYELFVEPLSAEEKEQLYQQSKRFGQLFGIPEQRYPESWVDFRNWWDGMLRSDTLTVTDTARSIYRGLLTGTWFTRVLAPFNYAMAAMLLPERLAASFDMRRSLPVCFTFRAIVATARVVVRLLPRRLRGVSAARRAEHRHCA
jgi:uncharacterized protein (DUF2236 family)